MSVIVKGMEMPESCYYCGLTDTSFINCMAFEKPIVLEDDCEETRPDWCPLVALPDKHGRLVDADEMLKRLQAWNTSDRMDKALYNFAWHRIMEQPTIVESEDGT